MAGTPKHEPEGRYAYGTPEEVANRLEHGMEPTESHFSQIRPNVAASGEKLAGQKGTTKNNRANINHRG